jgi:hypothetical protein
MLNLLQNNKKIINPINNLKKFALSPIKKAIIVKKTIENKIIRFFFFKICNY